MLDKKEKNFNRISNKNSSKNYSKDFSDKDDNGNLIFVILSLIISMILLSFASSPLYSLFCKATGFGGTTQRIEGGVSNFHVKKDGRLIKVFFDSNIDPKLNWNFVPKHKYAYVKTGQISMVFYEVENKSDEDIVGTAIYNVTPDRAGIYFVKVDCFCFQEQIIKAKTKILLPVAFYIDGSFDDDPDIDYLNEITLSYSFFKVQD